MESELRQGGLAPALAIAAGLAIAAVYRIMVYRAQRRLRGMSTRDRERHLPAILGFDRWLRRLRPSLTIGRRRGRRRKRGG